VSRPKQSLAERLLVLTLALEASLQQENWSEASALFGEREALLGQIEAAGSIPISDARRIADIEKRILELLSARRAAVLQGFRDGAQERNATKVYRKRSDSGCFERVA
jgi:hypothetical protein